MKNKTLEQIQNEIKLLREYCPFGCNNLDTYIQIENKIINYYNSYNLFIQELEDKKIIEEKTILIEKKEKILSKNYGGLGNNEYEELKSELNKEKEKNKNLEVKIQQLEKELMEEKNKKSGELMNADLRKLLNNEILKYNNLKKQIEEENALKMILGKESKESMVEAIIEKDKEIKELKAKLSRLPFTIEEGEELLSIIFLSQSQQLYYSAICKKTLMNFIRLKVNYIRNFLNILKKRISLF